MKKLRVAGAGTGLPAGSVTDPCSVRATVSLPCAGEASVKAGVELDGAPQVTPLSARAVPLTLAVKSDVATVEHCRGSEKAAVTVLLPAPAVIDVNVGTVTSTVTARVAGGETQPAPSVAWNTHVCNPSVSDGGVKLPVAAAVPQPVPGTAAKAPPSRLAPTWATPRRG